MPHSPPMSGKIQAPTHNGRTQARAWTQNVRTVSSAPMRNVHVPLGERSYAIQIATGLLSRLGEECAALKLGSRCAIISDANVARRYGRIAEKSLRTAGFDPIVIKVPA